MERFGIDSSPTGAVNLEVRRYLGYLSAYGFLKTLGYNPYQSQRYIVVYGQLSTPAKLENPSKTILQPRQAPGDNCGQGPAGQLASTMPGARTDLAAEHWLWRASWPRWEDIVDQAATLFAASEDGEYSEALLHEISPSRRPDDPLECATILAQWGVPQSEVM